MEFKFKKSNQFTSAGWTIIFLVIFLDTICTFSIFRGVAFNVNGNIIQHSFISVIGPYIPAVLLMALFSAFFVYLGYLSFTMYKRAYIKISEGCLWIYKAPLSKSISIPLANIETARILGVKLIFTLSSEPSRKEEAIFLSYLYVIDVEKLIETLSQNHVPVGRI